MAPLDQQPRQTFLKPVHIKKNFPTKSIYFFKVLKINESFGYNK